MSMTAYNILECRRNTTTKQNKSESRTNVAWRARVTPLSRERDGGVGRAPHARSVAAGERRFDDDDDVYRDTRPSGERESGSYSGTRQRNRIQFGPS